MQNVVYTETEVEIMLKLPLGRIKSWRRGNYGPAWVQLGRERRYRWSDIQDFLNDNAFLFITTPIPPWAVANEEKPRTKYQTQARKSL
jgi:hypothetical protein